MDTERDEIYERIPWETLEKKGGDRRWIVYVLAGAVALGTLAYSFTRNQPVAPVPTSPTAVATTVPASPSTTPPATSPSTVASPLVVAEADLYAVDPERIIDQARAHAEWFAVEYVSADAGEESQAILAALLPAGIPLPSAPEGTQVYVDWAGAIGVEEVAPMTYDVSVLVRSLLSADTGGFTRQPPRVVVASVEVTDQGPRVASAPVVSVADPGPSATLELEPIPDELLTAIEGAGDVVGGRRLIDGTWEVVTVVTSPDGVARPVTVRP